MKLAHHTTPGKRISTAHFIPKGQGLNSKWRQGQLGHLLLHYQCFIL